jgi:hypothetical protein
MLFQVRNLPLALFKLFRWKIPNNSSLFQRLTVVKTINILRSKFTEGLIDFHRYLTHLLNGYNQLKYIKLFLQFCLIVIENSTFQSKIDLTYITCYILS